VKKFWPHKHGLHWKLFDFGRSMRLTLVPVIDDWYRPLGWWLSGRVFGKLVSMRFRGGGMGGGSREGGTA
jgi:hypothetical protein